MDNHSEFHSQFGQDAFLEEYVFKGMRQGIFVDVGAHDGVTFSNSYFFEVHRSWSGLCLEPNPDVFGELIKARKSLCLQLAAFSSAGTLEFQLLDRDCGDNVEMLSGLKDHLSERDVERIQEIVAATGRKMRTAQVDTARLADVLRDHDVPIVHLISIDTEGSEFEVLKGIDFGATFIHVACIENNYKNPHLSTYMSAQGFIPLVQLGVDQVFINGRSELCTPRLRTRVAIDLQFGRIERRLRRLGILSDSPARYPFKRIKSNT